MLAVPPAVLDVLNLQAGAQVGIAVKDGCLVVEPPHRPRYRLADLLARHPKAARRRADRDWVSGKRAGRELI